MKKIIGIFFLCLCLSLVFVSCGETTSTDESLDTAVEELENAVNEEVDSSDDPTADFTTEQKNAYKSGLSYIDTMGFSKQGLIDQLSSEYGDGYPQDVAEFAVNKIEENGEVDWDAECEESAKSYLDTMSFSKDGLIDQLSSDYGDKYTREQAERAVDKVYE